MISFSLTIWLHLGRGVTRVVLGHSLGLEIQGPVLMGHRAGSGLLSSLPAPPRRALRTHRVFFVTVRRADT